MSSENNDKRYHIRDNKIVVTLFPESGYLDSLSIEILGQGLLFGLFGLMVMNGVFGVMNFPYIGEFGREVTKEVGFMSILGIPLTMAVSKAYRL
jgi:hypothetical protein